MVTRRSILLGLAALLIGTSLGAQEQDRKAFIEEAGGLSTLFRGKLPSPLPFRYNGTYFLDSKTFQKGSVQYNGKYYEDIYLNLDALNQELVARPSAKASGVILYRDQVSWFTLGEKRFVNLRYMGYDKAPEGYFQLVQNGRNPLLMLTRKIFQADTNGNGNAVMADADGNYDPSVVNYFAREEQYYSLENGQLKKLRRRAWRRRLQEGFNEQESPLTLSAGDWHPLQHTPGGELPRHNFNSPVIGLPGGFFDDRKEDTTVVQYQNNALTATFRNKIYPIGQGGKAKGGKATVSGTVFEAESGLPLPGVVIYDDNTSTYVRSNAKGAYRITLPVGENMLNFNAESKEDLALKVIVEADGSLDIVMTEKITLLKGSIISAESMQQHRTTVIGVESVSMKTIGKIPSAFGEGDIIKAVLTLPGVKSVGEASGGFNVRGGSADQNLILFNDNTIYNPSHLFGMFSAFNPDLVDNVELYKSSIPAEYGGRISSVLSVTSKEGDLNKFKGSLGIGLLTSRLHLEAPLVKGKTSFVAGGRITYSDWILNRLPANSAYSGGGAGFADANLGITHHFNSRHSLQAFGYFATDRFSFSNDTTFHYTNINGSLAYKYKGDDGSSFRLSAGYDHYTNIIGAHYWEGGAYDLQTYIRQAFLKAKREKVLGNHRLSYGLDATGYALDPGIMTPFGSASEVEARALAREYAVEPSLYLADDWKIGQHFSVDGGIRFSSFLALTPERQFYCGPEFRLATKFSPLDNLSFKAGFNTMRQYIHLISNTSAISPMDTWKLSSPEIAPTTGWQGAAGIYWTLLGAGLDLSLEGYYKESQNGLDYKPGAVLSMNEHLAQDLVPVLGKAYGVEVMLKKPAGKLTGWITYSYSRSMLREMQDRGAETINGGAWYNAPYDKPHEFKLVANWAMTHRFSFSVNVDYSTGRPVTVPIGQYYYNGAWRLAYSQRNIHRIPDYFRVDAAFNIDPGHYLKAIAHTSITIGVYNVTGRKNPYSVFFQPDKTGALHGYMLSVFATQIPYINLNILF